MRLDHALKAVLRFAAKGKKAQSILGSVRFLPAEGTWPARVLGFNGEVGCFVPVDGDLPNMLLPAEPLKPVSKQKVTRVVVPESCQWCGFIHMGGPENCHRDHTGLVCLETSAGLHTVQRLDEGRYPSWPPPPTSLDELEEWSTIHKLVHAAAKADAIPGRPDLSCLHLAPDHAGASDQERIVWADVRNPVQASVPRELFANWPRSGKRVWAAVEGDYSFFKVGEELRFGRLCRAKPPAVRRYVREWHQGGYGVVEARDFEALVRHSADAAPTGRLRIRLGALDLKVSSSEGEFLGSVPMMAGFTMGKTVEDLDDMVVNAKHLKEALRVVDTPKVRVCCEPGRHLRLEHGAVTEYVLLSPVIRRAAA